MNITDVIGNTLNKEIQDQITPDAAIELLKAGNARFLDNNRVGRKYEEQIAATSGGQWPFAAILSCIDSRVPTEIVFDQGIGDIFNARVAGNIINEDILGSLEYACKVAGSKAIVVLGHSGCGAVKGACDDVKLGNITTLLNKIKPAIEATEESGDRSSSNADFVQRVVDKNVDIAIKNIKAQSTVLSEMLNNNEIAVVGAIYDVKTGKVDFL